MDRPWGRWTRLYMDDQVELRRLEVEEGGYCTRHYHREQANVLFVVRGMLRVMFFGNDPDQMPKAPGTWYMLVPAGVESRLTNCETIEPITIHQFHAETPVIAYELNVATGPNPLDPSDSVQLGPAGKGELP